MEISPVNGICALPVMKVPPADRGISAVFDIENSSRAGDETWSRSPNQSTGGQDEDPDETEEGEDPEAQPENPRQVSFFA